MPAFASPERVKLVVYPGGHMFYSRDGSRQAFRSEVEALMKREELGRAACAADISAPSRAPRYVPA